MRRAPPERRASRGPARSQTSSTRPFDSPARRSRKKRRADTARPVARAHESFRRTEYFSKQWQELRTRANQNGRPFHALTALELLDTTTKPAVDSLSPRPRSVERVRERGNPSTNYNAKHQT